MIESYFQYQSVLRRMRCGPLATEIDEIADELLHRLREAVFEPHCDLQPLCFPVRLPPALFHRS